MKRLIIAALFLSACSPVTPAPANLAQARADIDGQVSATGTAERVENRAATATAWYQSAEATRIYIDKLQYESAATQSAIATQIVKTQISDSATETAIVTAQHVDQVETQRAGEIDSIKHNNAVRLITTQAAQTEKDVTRYSDGWFNVFVCGSLIVAAIAIMLTAFLGSQWLPPIITALGENKSRTAIARGIHHSLTNNGHQAVIQTMPATNGLPNMEVRVIKGNGHSTEPTPEAIAIEHSSLHPDNADVLRGLQHMAGIVGGHSEQLPSSANRIESGLYNEIYQPLINALSKSNDVGAREGKSGIFVNSLKWKDLDDLMAGIMDGRVDLSNRVLWNGNKRPAEL